MEGQQYRFTVCVRSLIYNHEKYINDCLRGFMMQEVNFPVVFLLEDDASTDSTSQILSDWVNTNFNVEDKEVARVIDFEGAVTTFAQHRTNPYFFVAYIQMKYNHYGKYSRDAYNSEWCTSAKYEALCEGDDYWTDPLKLQKQVDFLEGHPEYSMCFHRCQTLMSQTGEIVDEFIVPDMHGESTIEDLAKGNFIHTLSVVYRRDDDVQKRFASLGPCMPGDYVLWMMNAEKGKIWKFEEPMGVYRYGSGIWAKNSSVDNDLQYLITLTKLWMVVNNPIAKKHLQEQIKNQRRMIDSLERSERDELISVRSSKAYRLGKFLLKPLKWFKR